MCDFLFPAGTFASNQEAQFCSGRVVCKLFLVRGPRFHLTVFASIRSIFCELLAVFGSFISALGLSLLSGPHFLKFLSGAGGELGAVQSVWVCCRWAVARGKTSAVATTDTKLGLRTGRNGLVGARGFVPVVGHRWGRHALDFRGWVDASTHPGKSIHTPYVYIHATSLCK